MLSKTEAKEKWKQKKEYFLCERKFFHKLKPFDILEWSCIHHVLKLYNFGDSLRNWVKVFCTDIESAILNNDYATNWIKPSTGVRQGCPLSPYLFIQAAELQRSMKIRQVKGISIFEREIKISQFADDTNLLCFDLSSVGKGLQIAVDFGEISGLRLNLEKTKAMWLGKWSSSKSKPSQLKWVSSPTRILDIFFSYDEKGNNEINFNLKIDKLQTNLDIWKSRDFTSDRAGTCETVLLLTLIEYWTGNRIRTI